MAKPGKRRAGVSASEVGERIARKLSGAAPARVSREERLERARKDIKFFCEYYLHEYFSRPPAAFHGEMMALIGASKRVACAAPREHAKSTIVSLAKPLHAICFGLLHFIVLVRASEAVAKSAVADIRTELESNDRIREDFGDLVGGDKWAEDQFITSKGVKVQGLGRGSAARGLRYRQHRPDLVIVDDIEDDEAVESRLQREKLDRWFKKVVLSLGREAAVFVVGTVLHREGLLETLLKSPAFTTRRWKAIDEHGKVLWPAVWSAGALEKKRAEIGPRAFGSEFLNEPANEEDQIFRPEWFRRYKDADVAQLPFEFYAAIDPAIGQKARNDDTAVAVVGLHEGRYYLMRMRMKKLTLHAQVDLVLGTYADFPRVRKFGFETVAYQAALKQAVQEESRRRGAQVPAVAVDDQGSDKIRRISRLQPLAEQGLLWVPDRSSRYWSPDVEKCLEQFADLGCSPNAHDDGPDAVERAIALARGRMGKKARAVLIG